MPRHTLNDAPLVPTTPQPLLTDDDSTIITVLVTTLLTLRQSMKDAEDTPLRPAHFGAIRDLIAFAARIAAIVVPEGTRYTPIVTLPQWVDEHDGVLYLHRGHKLTPHEEALGILWLCKAVLSMRTNGLLYRATRQFQLSHGLATDLDRLMLSMTPPRDRSGHPLTPQQVADFDNPRERKPQPATLSPLDLAVTRLLPRLNRHIKEVEASFSASDEIRAGSGVRVPEGSSAQGREASRSGENARSAEDAKAASGVTKLALSEVEGGADGQVQTIQPSPPTTTETGWTDPTASPQTARSTFPHNRDQRRFVRKAEARQQKKLKPVHQTA